MAGDTYLKCGTVADVYATVDFGPWGDTGKDLPDYSKEIMNNDYYFLISFFS